MSRGGGQIVGAQGHNAFQPINDMSANLLQHFMMKESLNLKKEQQKLAQGELKIREQAAQAEMQESQAQAANALAMIGGMLEDPEMMQFIQQQAPELVGQMGDVYQQGTAPAGMGHANADTGAVNERMTIAGKQAVGLQDKLLDKRARFNVSRSIRGIDSEAGIPEGATAEEARSIRDLAAGHQASLNQVADMIEGGATIEQAIAIGEHLGLPPDVMDAINYEQAKVTLANAQDAREADAIFTGKLAEFGINTPEGMHLPGAAELYMGLFEMQRKFDQEWRLEMARRGTLSQKTEDAIQLHMLDNYSGFLRVGMEMAGQRDEQGNLLNPDFDPADWARTQMRDFSITVDLPEVADRLESVTVERDMFRREARLFAETTIADELFIMHEDMDVRARGGVGRFIDRADERTRNFIGLPQRDRGATEEQINAAERRARERYMRDGRAQGFPDAMLQSEWRKGVQQFREVLAENPREIIEDYNVTSLRFWTDRRMARERGELYGREVAERGRTSHETTTTRGQRGRRRSQEDRDYYHPERSQR